MIGEKIVDFASVPRKLWIRFKDESEYKKNEDKLRSDFADLDGKDSVVIYCMQENKRILWPESKNIQITSQLLSDLRAIYGNKNVETT